MHRRTDRQTHKEPFNIRLVTKLQNPLGHTPFGLVANTQKYYEYLPRSDNYKKRNKVVDYLRIFKQFIV